MKGHELPNDLNIVITGINPSRPLHHFTNWSTPLSLALFSFWSSSCFYGRCQCVFRSLECSFECLRGLPVFACCRFHCGYRCNPQFYRFICPFVWLGIIVDDAIVVIENTHRIYDNGKVPIVKAAKAAAGEVFIPVLAGTATTIAPFFPLLFWKGIIGKFMIYLPTMLIFTLFASLIVVFIINPVFAVSSMKPEGREYEPPKMKYSKNGGSMLSLCWVF